MTRSHLAAIHTAVGSALSLASRPTPTPAPYEILIETKAIAVNPVDYYQRDLGRPPNPFFPAVLGEDVAGIVVSCGSYVPNAPEPGTRVLAFASSFYQSGSADHGAFQKMVVARFEGVIPFPEKLTFEEGSIMPLAVLTALSAYTTLGMPLEKRISPVDKEGFLVWGASSSVGTFAVQTAKTMGYTVYATAGSHNLEYVKSLGASAAFDYKAGDVGEKIAAQAKADGVQLRTAHVCVEGALQQTLDVLKITKGDGAAKVAHAALLPEPMPTLEGTEIKFTFPPTDPEVRNKHILKCFHGWLKDGLATGAVVPSPRVRVIEGGLGGLNEALNELSKGVSGTKLVVSV
ncbi:MAG: hypothetical protein Q9174_003116 [Haloplaca sp. 1 TL-2023]